MKRAILFSLFAALALSEVARADRVEAFLTVEELVTLVVKS